MESLEQGGGDSASTTEGSAGGASPAGNKGGAGGDAIGSASADSAESSGNDPGSVTALLESDALALVPLFTDHTEEMNYLNNTSGAMSLATDIAGIASSIGQGGSLAGFLRDLGHTCCSSPGALRQAIRVSS